MSHFCGLFKQPSTFLLLELAAERLNGALCVLMEERLSGAQADICSTSVNFRKVVGSSFVNGDLSEF